MPPIDTHTAPLVSIIAPMYNLEAFIAQTINSVLAQTYQNYELILVDDCSSDATIEIVQTFKDPRIQLIENDVNQGAGESRNFGIRAAKGQMIAFLDADDLWYPDKLMQQIDFMNKTGSGVVYTRYDVIDAEGTVYTDSGQIPAKGTYHRLLRHNFIRTSSLIYNIEKCGGKVYFPLIRKRQDFILFLDLIKRAGQADLLDVNTCSYRLHPGGISANKRSVIPYQWAAYRKEEKLSLLYSTFLMANWFVRAGMVTIKRKIKERNST